MVVLQYERSKIIKRFFITLVGAPLFWALGLWVLALLLLVIAAYSLYLLTTDLTAVRCDANGLWAQRTVPWESYDGLTIETDARRFRAKSTFLVVNEKGRDASHFRNLRIDVSLLNASADDLSNAIRAVQRFATAPGRANTCRSDVPVTPASGLSPNRIARATRKLTSLA